MNKKTKIIIGIISTGACLVLTAPFLTSCSLSNQFVFGNFQSYMNPIVQQKLNAKLQNINWQYYNSNNEVPTYLVNKTINAAVVTNNMIVKLASNNMIKKIDWSIFKLLDKNQQVINNMTGLADVFSELTYKITTEVFQKYNINLLDYCFPYFLQNFVFVYRGKEIPELSKPNVTFTDIFKALNSDPRFLTNSAKPKVMMVKDSRTIYGISEIISDEEKQQEININPERGLLNQDSKVSIKEFEEKYHIINEKITNQNLKIGLNSDSNVLINQIVLNQINGAFMYNGDAIFAGLGGDYGGKKYNNKLVDFPTSDDFHIVSPKNTILCLDGIVINNNISDQEAEKLALKTSYNITMSGANVEEWNEWNKPINDVPQNLNPQDLDILQVDDNDEYIFLSTMNFDYVNYTPPMKKMYDAVSKDSIYFHDFLTYQWESTYGTLTIEQQAQITELAKVLTKTIELNIPTTNIANLVEMPLNSLTDSNMQWAFRTFYNGLPG